MTTRRTPIRIRIRTASITRREAVRAASLVLIGSVPLSFALAGACSEHFPQPLASESADAGVLDGGPSPPLETAPPALIPLAGRLSVASSALVFDPVRGGLWTANGDVGSVSYTDVDHGVVIAETPVGIDVRSVALSPDGKWLAAVDRGGGAVALIDAASRKLVRMIGTGTHPRAAVWDAADPRWLYVAVEDDDAVAVIDRTLGLLSATIPVGRLPSGVAVAGSRRELYVTHRIDGRVTVVPLPTNLDGGALAGTTVDIPLALEIGDGTATTPHGTPFGFESLAWATDGTTAWVPHELIAPTHPLGFQFQQVLFPTVSVVDLTQRAEVVTDPNDPSGLIAGRKNLFGAIAIPGPTGAPSIVSQPCAAAFHPNGSLAYVVACASEDLLTFDLTRGVAVDLLRGLPGDHPLGIALDAAGTRAFVLADQSEDPAPPAPALHSKSLHVIDLGGGSPLAHPKVVGAPIPLVAHDPLDPAMRNGLRFFFRANSAKGDLATTGSSWLSCGGCHLDGFGGASAAFFEDLFPIDVTVDARLGHLHLVDFFSTVPPANAPTDSPFNPHDVLSAFEEQGGLAPDRTGVDRTGAVDPSNPSTAALTMATDVGRVIAGSLPLGPSWLRPPATKADLDYDTAWCGQCHPSEYAAWQKSAHARAGADPMVHFGAAVESKNNGSQYPRLCAGCHDPVSAAAGDTSLASGRGITCLGCHDTERSLRAGGNADLEVSAFDWTQSHKERATSALTTLRDPVFCGGCHEQFVPGTGMEVITTLHEWEGSAYAGGTGGAFAPEGGAGPVTRCVDCHAPVGADGIADHAMIGGNVYLASQVTGDPAMTASVTANLKSAILLEASRSGNVVDVTVRNRASGHAFPTGVTDIREPWVEIQAVDDLGNVVARYGGPAADGTIPLSAARFGMDIAKPDGTLLFLHELSASTKIPFQRFVPALGSVVVHLDVPAALPTGAAALNAVLLYRNVRTPYFRAATGDPAAIAPEVEVARVPVH